MKSATREEEDLVARTTKKVKTYNDSIHQGTKSVVKDIDMTLTESEQVVTKHKEIKEGGASYKDSLLNHIGDVLESDENLEDIENMPNLEDKWYEIEENEDDLNKRFDPCPTIPVTREENEKWYKPWRLSLIVKCYERE